MTNSLRRLVAGGPCVVLLAGLLVACVAEPPGDRRGAAAGPGDSPAPSGSPAPGSSDQGSSGPGSSGSGSSGSGSSGSGSSGSGSSGSGSSGPGSSGPGGASDPGSLDLHRSGDLGFYASFNMDGPDWAEHFGTLDEGARASTVVVVAKAVDVVVTRMFQGEVAEDRFPMIGVVLQPTDVVAGALPPGFSDRLTVEFVGSGATDDEQIATLRRRLPAQQGLWFLRRKGDPAPGASPVPVAPRERDYFRTISPQGLFVQGNDRVETPLTREGDGEMAAEGRTYRRLSQLVALVRGIR
ncbi:hypothetical protein [Asanoa siamensis]|uniref:Uncharacterized protein n=1 Tax=Asanoa siamensis TaxID=926357 RepID=A0ABQ4CNG4_9ACTN|nr:hypothetical protein [Asanoa siamensis]GIF72367.1 hypothetical protein Asi02nite_18850 [Asanoa siamensis]